LTSRYGSPGSSNLRPADLFQECKFRLGSYQYRINQLVFALSNLEQDVGRTNVLLEYMRVVPLQSTDDIFTWRDIGNYSISGFRIQMKRRSFKFTTSPLLCLSLFLGSASSFLQISFLAG
jgi:hypothetical protein